MRRIESYVDNVITDVYAGLLCWIFQNTLKKVPFDAVVDSAEVKLAVLILNYDACSCDFELCLIFHNFQK